MLGLYAHRLGTVLTVYDSGHRSSTGSVNVSAGSEGQCLSIRLPRDARAGFEPAVCVPTGLERRLKMIAGPVQAPGAFKASEL